MGLLVADHPNSMSKALRAAILDAFSLVIVNEYDLAHGVRVKASDLLPHPTWRHATCSCSIRPPGATSGDGRSVWNGTWRHAGAAGIFRAAARGHAPVPRDRANRRFYKTGSRTASYGCGTASVEEGMAAAVMSEVLNRSGIRPSACWP
jgi:hypothetical protein